MTTTLRSVAAGPLPAEVDGTRPGRAVLIGFDVANPGQAVFRMDFTEGPGCPDPLAAARAMRRWQRPEHPGHTFIATGDHRANYLAWRNGREEAGLGYTDLSPEGYLAARQVERGMAAAA